MNEIAKIMKELESSFVTIKKNDPIAKYLKMIESIIAGNYEAKPYLNTNQNQQYIRNLINTDIKNAFVILSGGDVIFQLLLNDIFDITAVDVNPLQKLIFALKCASIKTLSVSDYESFLVDRLGINFCSRDIFKTVQDGFTEEEDIKRFWQIFINTTPQEDLREVIFKGGAESMSIDIARNSLQFIKRNKFYFKLRENLEKANITLKEGDAVDVLLQDSIKYDYIDLSNILLFVIQYSNSEEWQQYLTDLYKIYKDNLNDKGLMVLDYMYSTDPRLLTPKEDTDTRKIYYEILTSLKEYFELQYNTVSSIPGVLPVSGNTDTAIYVPKITLN